MSSVGSRTSWVSTLSKFEELKLTFEMSMRQPFKMLLEDDDQFCWDVMRQQDPGCSDLCPFVEMQTDFGEYGCIEARYPICTGFVSERACYAGEERYMESGAKSCRLYQISQGKRYPDEDS
jgi:hypothetical protein